MKVSFTKIAVVLSLCIIIFASICPPSLATPRRVEECGIESYVSRADPICGVASYISTRSAACGVERYKEQQSTSCPGYISRSALWIRFGDCPAGHLETDTRVQSKKVCSDPHVLNPFQASPIFVSNTTKLARGSGCSTEVWTERLCVRSEVTSKCRLPAFGVDMYNQCVAPSHGVASYNTCARQEFGVALFSECEIRRTRSELTAYIQNLEPNIDVMGVALIQNTGNLLKLGGNETAMACYIKRWESDPLYKDAIDELKTIQFPALFGVTYDPNNYDCSNPPLLSVSTESCSDGTPRCKFQTAYNAALKFFETNKAEVTALIDDIVARTDSTYKTQLESLNAKLDSYYKS